MTKASSSGQKVLKSGVSLNRHLRKGEMTCGCKSPDEFVYKLLKTD